MALPELAVDADGSKLTIRQGLVTAANPGSASAIATPNLLSRSPVARYGCVSGSMSGLTRSATATRWPSARARVATRASSSADSTLIARSPAEIAASISASSLPTPLKTIFPAGIPAAIARASSPPETMSAPAPRRASVRSTAWLLLAFTA